MTSQLSFGPRFHPRSAPVTFWFLAATTGLYLVLFAASLSPLSEQLVAALSFSPATYGRQPWTVLTYPFVNYLNPFWYLLFGYCLWWCGADLERWWGSRIHAGVLVAVAVGTALMVTFGALLAPQYARATLQGAEPLLAALFCVWGLRNPRANIILLFVPVSGTVVAVLAVAGIWFAHGVYLGFFAALGSAGLAALYYYRGQRFHSWLRRIGGDPARRAARQRDRKFQKILKGSGLHLVDDDEPTEPRPQ